MVVAYSLRAAFLSHTVDFHLYIQSRDVIDIFCQESVRYLFHDGCVAPDRTGGQNVFLGCYILFCGSPEGHAFVLFLDFVQFGCHGLHSFFLGGLVVKGYSIHLAVVHLPYPVTSGCSFFNLHGIILLKKVYKNNSQRKFRLQAVPGDDTIFLQMWYPSGVYLKPFGVPTPGGFSKVMVVKSASMVYNMLNKRANG